MSATRVALLRRRVKRYVKGEIYEHPQEWQYYTVPLFPGPEGVIMPDSVEFVAWVPNDE